jgi:hypothetical protein
MSELNSDFFEQVLAATQPGDILLYSWVMGADPSTGKSSCCTGPMIGVDGIPMTLGQHDPLEVASTFAYAYPEYIDPEGFDFGILHAVPASELLMFNEIISRWIHSWMTGRATKCDYPDVFLKYVVAVSLDAGRSGPAPSRLPLTKGTPS